jgi:hypothetical protein
MTWRAAAPGVAGAVHRPLTRTALAVAGHDAEPAFLVSVDGGWRRAATDEAMVRGRMLHALGCAEDRLLLDLDNRDLYQVWQTQLAPGGLEALIEAADAPLAAS